MTGRSPSQPAVAGTLPDRRRSILLWIAAVTITAAIAALLSLEATLEWRSAAKRIGIQADDSSGQFEVATVTPGLPADRAGVRGGDILVGINDAPVSGIRDYDRIISGFEPGGTLDFTINRDGELRRLRLAPGTGFPWIRYLSVLGPVLAYLAVGLLCLLHWRQDLRARLLAVLVLSIATELALPIYTIGYPVATVAAEMAYFVLTGIQIAVELHLVSMIPSRAPWLARWPGLVRLFYALGLGLGAMLATAALTDFLTPDRHVPWPTDVGYGIVGWILPFWAVSIGLMLCYQMVRYPSPRGRQQAGLILVGVAPWILVTLVETGANIAGHDLGERWYNISNWTLLAFPLAIFVAIFRYHLFDLELVVRRSLVYGSITALLIGLLYAVLAAAWPLASNLLSPTGAAWVVTGLALGLGVAAGRLRHGIEDAIEIRVFPERHALRRHLISLAASLPVRGKLPLMGNHLADEACLAFRATSSAVIMIDPRTQLPYTLATSRMSPDDGDALSALFRTDPRLEQVLSESRRPVVVSRLRQEPDLVRRLEMLGVAVIAPLSAHDNFIGALCLGTKKNRAAFPGEELELLNLLTHHAVTAFENARLAEHATYEGLTGLYRREVVMEILERECARAVQCEEPIGVAMIDIDRFKAFNDRHGHLAGDVVLQRVARTLQTELRSTDMIGRFGGEEFLAVLPDTNLHGAQRAAEHLRAAVDVLRVPLDTGDTARVSVSIGLAAMEVARGDPAELARSLIQAADQYLYAAKDAGRNRVVAGQFAVGAA